MSKGMSFLISVAVLGHGVVGSGVVEILRGNAAHIAHKAGEELVVKRILDLRTFPELPYADLFTANFDDIVNDADIRIVVEAMGGLHPAYEFVKASLLAGKNVVTSNKELVAAKGDELLAIAREKNLNFLFEASVGGGIPILRPLDQCLAANNVLEVAGILNGTTNFMLTKMFEEGMDFGEALALAQQLGYAERNPDADVEGLDACRKIAILASLAFGKHVSPDEVYTEGITAITVADVACAAAYGGVIKLIGRTSLTADGKVYCTVSPMILPRDNLLAGVKDVFNAVMVRGDSVGDVVFVGRGAGKLPTASAVVADVIDCAKHFKARKYLFWEPGEPGRVLDYRTATVQKLVRLTADDMEATKARITAVFGDVPFVEVADALAFVSPAMTETTLEAALRALTGVTVVSALRIFVS